MLLSDVVFFFFLLGQVIVIFIITVDHLCALSSSVHHIEVRVPVAMVWALMVMAGMWGLLDVIMTVDCIVLDFLLISIARNMAAILCLIMPDLLLLITIVNDIVITMSTTTSLVNLTVLLFFLIRTEPLNSLHIVRLVELVILLITPADHDHL